jgi:hypothetical protein
VSGADRIKLSARRAIAPTRVSFARLRSRPSRTALLTIGIAAAVAVLVGVLGGTVIARDLSLQRLVAERPTDERSFRVDMVGLPAGQDQAALDAAARRALGELSASDPLRVVAFRDFWLDGQFVRVTGVDQPLAAVRLVSGRLPRRCDVQWCEVLQVGSSGQRTLREAGINFLRVGVGELREPARYGSAFTHLRQLRAQGSYPQSTVLVAANSDVIERLPSLELLQRVRSWIVPVTPSSIHEWQVDDLLASESRAQAILAEADPEFTLAGPDSVLLEARARGDVYARRMLLIGAGVAVALFGFAIVAAVGMRRGRAAA